MQKFAIAITFIISYTFGIWATNQFIEEGFLRYPLIVLLSILYSLVNTLHRKYTQDKQ